MMGVSHLTFGRNITFVSELAIVTTPVVIASLLQSPPTLFVGVKTWTLAIVSLVATILGFCFAYIMLTKVGASTYSPRLHQTKFILSSIIYLYLFSIVSVLIGYWLLVYPYTGHAVPGLRDSLAGLTIVALYVIALASIVTVSVWSSERNRKKDKLICEFLTSANLLRESNIANAKELSDTVESTGGQLVENLNKEPMPDASSLGSSLHEWLDDFKGNSVPDRRRMVGWTPGAGSEREEPWESHLDQFKDLEQELSELAQSATDEPNNGR